MVTTQRNRAKEHRDGLHINPLQVAPAIQVDEDGNFPCPCGSTLTSIARSRVNKHFLTVRHREWLANLLLDGVRIYNGIKFGRHSVSIGALIKSTGDQAPAVEGDIAYRTTGANLQYQDATGTRIVPNTSGTEDWAADQSWGNNKITSMANGTNASDAVNKGQLDAIAAGLAWKDSVRLATDAAGVLATDFENGDTVDGFALVTGDRILIKDQGAGAENGIYTVELTGTPTRAVDADTGPEILAAAVFVEEGTVNEDTGWVNTTDAPITIDVTALVFVQFTGGAVSGGDGIDVTGSVVSVDLAAAAGLDFLAGQLKLGDPSNNTVSSSNAVTATSHTHAITSSDNPGAAASILASDSSGFLSLVKLISTEIEFSGTVTIDANGAGTTSIVLTNQGAGVADIVIDGRITSGADIVIDANNPGASNITLTNQSGGDAQVNIDEQIESTGDMVLDANSGSDTTVTIINEGAGTASLVIPAGTAEDAIVIGAGGLAGDIKPIANGVGRCGISGAAFLEVRALTVFGGDIVLDNGMRFTEAWGDGTQGMRKPGESIEDKGGVKGTIMKNEQGDVLFMIDDHGNMHLKGKVIEGMAS